MLRSLPYLIVAMAMLFFSKSIGIWHKKSDNAIARTIASSISATSSISNSISDIDTDKKSITYDDGDAKNSDIKKNKLNDEIMVSASAASPANSSNASSASSTASPREHIIGQSTKSTQESNKEQNVTKDKELYNAINEHKFSQAEIDLLQQLREKRIALQNKEDIISIEANALEAVKVDIDTKIKLLDNINKKRETSSQSLDDNGVSIDKSKIARLVKVYENMRPQDAAKIFDELGINVLMNIVNAMKEQKLAAIIAVMTPEKAKQLTMAMSTQ